MWVTHIPVTIHENGIPQESVLSVTLFAVAINGLPDVIGHLVQLSLFVNDFQIQCQIAVMHSI